MSRAVANSSCTQGGGRGGGRFGCNHRACVWQRGAARPAGNAKTSAVLAGSYDRLRAQSSAEHVQHARGKGTHRRQLRGAEPGKKAAQKNEGSAGHGCHNCFLERGLRWVTLAWNPRASARYLKSPTLSVWVERMRRSGAVWASRREDGAVRTLNPNLVRTKYYPLTMIVWTPIFHISLTRALHKD